MGSILSSDAGASQDEHNTHMYIDDAAFHPDSTLLRSSFFCPGTCAASLDRPFTCGTSSCTFFMRPLVESTLVKFSCPICLDSSPNPRMCCNATPSNAYRVDNSESIPIYNASQLPAQVLANDCGRHLHLPPLGSILHLRHRPGKDTVWQGRHVLFSRVQWQASSQAMGQGTDYIIVAPNQPVNLSCQYECSWVPSLNDYCPGCVVQWYLGLSGENRKSELEHEQPPQHQLNLIRVFQNGRRGRAEHLPLLSPSRPGFYYLTSNISLDYDFVRNVKFTNQVENSVAVMQVVYMDKWRPENHFLAGDAITKRAIATLFLLGMHPRECLTENPCDCPCRIISVRELQSKVFSFLGPYRD